MTVNGNNKQGQAAKVKTNNETALMIEGLYNGIAFDLQKMKKELLNELKYASVQSGAVYQSIQQETVAAYESMKKDLDEACKQIKEETLSAMNSVNDSASASAQNNAAAASAMVCELKYGYQQNEMIFEALSSILTDDVLTKLNSVDGKTELIAQIDEAVKLVEEKLNGFLSKPETDYEAIAETVKEKVVDALPVPEYIDYDKITDTVTESVAEKTETSLSAKSKEILDAVAAIPVPENVDYTRIVEEVSEKVLEKLNETLTHEEKEPAPEFDYDRVIYGAAEKVVESLPYPEKVDYRRIEEGFQKQAKGLKVTIDEEALFERIEEAIKKAVAEIDYDKIAELVAEKMPAPAEPEAFDYEKLAELVAAKMPAPVEPEPIDYDKLAELVAEKMPTPVEPEAIDYDNLAAMVAERIVLPEAEAPTYDVVVDDAGAQVIADNVANTIDYEALAEKTAEKLSARQAEQSEELVNEIAEKIPAPTYELLIDEEGANAIAEAVADKLKECCPVAAKEETAEETVEEAPREEPQEAEETVEESVEEAVEEQPEEVAQETAEETVEETVEETAEEAPREEPQEEVAEELPVVSELAVASTLAQDAEEDPNELVDADTGLVLRLKKSFKAKLCQSAPEVKSYYSTVKNELASYSRLNSNMSWHGDRFNFGRDTVARINISGKTLCFYVALDPADPEYKTTVYHQKDVSKQKAYENTPFMIKIKSETGAKRAARLVGYLAEKLGAEKKANFEPIDYAEEFGYASTKQLLDEGLIKVTKEKKVALDF